MGYGNENRGGIRNRNGDEMVAAVGVGMVAGMGMVA